MDKFKTIYTPKSQKKTNKYTMTTEQDSKVWTLSINWPIDSMQSQLKSQRLLSVQINKFIPKWKYVQRIENSQNNFKVDQIWMTRPRTPRLPKEKKIKAKRGRPEDRERAECKAEPRSRPVQTRSLWRGARQLGGQSARGRRQGTRSRHCAPLGKDEPHAGKLSTTDHRPKCKAMKHTKQNIRGDDCELSLRK